MLHNLLNNKVDIAPGPYRGPERKSRAFSEMERISSCLINKSWNCFQADRSTGQTIKLLHHDLKWNGSKLRGPDSRFAKGRRIDGPQINRDIQHISPFHRHCMPKGDRGHTWQSQVFLLKLQKLC